MIEQWGIHELSLIGPQPGNPFEVELTVRYRYRNRTVTVDGFYDGDGTYRARFSPDRLGSWEFVTSSPVSELDGHRGGFECGPPSAGNHGPVRVADTYHFRYADGSRYLPFGTTCYHWTHETSDEQQDETLQALAAAPFNKIRMCLLPTNEMRPVRLAFAGTDPSTVDRTRLNPEFFHHLEGRIADLAALGIEADLILFHPYDKGYWGFDNMSEEEDRRYLRYVIARLAAYRNVWWSLSNEYDFNHHKTVAQWDRLLQFVQQHDPYQRLRSIHNGTKMYETFTQYDFTKTWVTHQSVQHWDGAEVAAWRRSCAKPVVVDEIGYEGRFVRRWGNLTGQELTDRFWHGLANGGYIGHGEVFPDRGWISVGGRLQGESVERIAFLRRLMEAAPVDVPSADSYFLLYFGDRQPAHAECALPDRARYSVELIDAWNMTAERLAGSYSGRCRVPLPGRPYLALRISELSP